MNLTPPHLPVFDGHNDLLYQLWKAQDWKGTAFFNKDQDSLSVTLEKAKKGGFVGGLFAVFAPSGSSLEKTSGLDQKTAYQHAIQMMEIARNLAENHSDKVVLAKNIKDITSAQDTGKIAVMLHIEGAEAIGRELAELEFFYDKGVRSIGPLWSRPNIFGEGVSFDFPASPDQGSGLSDTGKALIKACDQLGIMVDVSHLNEAGFWDIAKISSQPLTATHSNAYALCPSPRNLTDRQLDAIAETGGLVGVCFASAYMRAVGTRNPDTGLDLILRQMDYLISRLGEGHVALGSDFDGAVLPSGLKDCTQLPCLIQAMAENGFGQELMKKLSFDNWIRRLSLLP